MVVCMPTTVAGGGRKCYDFRGRWGFDEAHLREEGIYPRPIKPEGDKEMLEAADMARYHQKTGPEGPVSLTGRIQKGPKTQSAGHNARLFFLRIFQGNATRFCGF